jgi:4-hydroxybenzoate polyprenyltransferase
MVDPARLAEARQLPPSRSPVRAALVALRPRQWLKNLLLFAGIIFAAEVGDPTRWLEATAAFFAYCAASSGAYLVNDIRDVAADRMHPVKRSRPIARGELRAPTALALACTLAVAAVIVAAALGLASLVCLLGFALLQAAYTFRLKHIVLVDVLVIAALFIIRAVAGAVAVDVRISPWLLVCTGLLALFLALGKRRAELVLIGVDGTPGRPVLEGYSLALVDRLLVAVAGATIVAYALYTLKARDSYALVATVPFVVVGLLRYLQLLHRHDAFGEEPENVLLGDMPILITVATWAALCAAILVL